MQKLTLLATIFCALYLAQCGHAVKFQEVVDVIKTRREELFRHQFFAFLSDESIAPQRRLQFMPYWTHFVMSLTDQVDSWVHIENPQNELEERINLFAEEDNWHYNFFLNDVEGVLGYTLDRYGSYEAVARHIWGDDSKAIRQFCYEFAAVVKNKDPMVVLTVLEIVEAGLADFFSTAYHHVYLPENGLKNLTYLGYTHLHLEMSHETVTNWYDEEEAKQVERMKPLELYDITEKQKETCVDIVHILMDRYAGS